MNEPTTGSDEIPTSTEGLIGLVSELRVKLSALEAIVGEREARIKELEATLEESRRSGKRQAAPFSKKAPLERPAKPGRKPGDAHGRHGHRMVPTHIDRELDAPLPEACPHCGGVLDEDEGADQFQTELPAPAPVVTRFRVHRGHCVDCGRRVQGRHPEQCSDALGAAGAQVGPRAKALATWFHYSLGLSFGRTAQVMGRLGVPITPGAIATAAAVIATQLAATHEAIKSALAGQACVTMDETGWRIGGHGAWLWVAASPCVTVYDIDWGRDFAAATKLLPADYSGVLVRDGWAVYRSYTDATHQSCIAHLLRRAHEMCDDNPEEERQTPLIVSLILKQALEARAGSKATRKKVVKELSAQLDTFRDVPQAYDPNRRLVAHVLGEHDRDALFTFLTQPEVDATNWRGETGVRPAVVNRKVWGGNRTEAGSVTQGCVMTFLRTAAQQGLDAIEALVVLSRSPVPGVVAGLALGAPQPGH